MVRLDRKTKANRKSHSDLKTVKISTVNNPLGRQSYPTWYAFYVPWYGSCCETNSVFGLDLPALVCRPHFPFNSFGFGRFYIDTKEEERVCWNVFINGTKKQHTPAKKKGLCSNKTMAGETTTPTRGSLGMVGEEFESYCKKHGLCNLCAQTKTHKREVKRVKKDQWKP